MKPNTRMFKKPYASHATEEVYSEWRDVFDGFTSYEWISLTNRFAEDFQFAILRALTIVGCPCSQWNVAIFRSILEQREPFEDVMQLYLRGVLDADWRYFADKMALDIFRPYTYFPSLFPEWLFPFGYTQQQYLADLGVYWDNIHDEYFRPWSFTRIGLDSPEIARLKNLGKQARSEIDQVARHSEQYLKREGKR
jgi:hypothetical protein